MVKVNIIKKLITSPNRDDILIGATFLNEKFEGNMNKIEKFTRNLTSLYKNRLDIYVGSINIYISSDGAINVNPGDQYEADDKSIVVRL